MSLCEIQDYVYALAADGTRSPVLNQAVVAMPQSTPLLMRDSPGQPWYELENLPTVKKTDGQGKWTLYLPWQSDSDPNVVVWQLSLPDGTVWQGGVPAVGGPLSVAQLKNSYGWAAVAAGNTAATVASGPQGNPGPTVVWRGGWGAGTAYNQNDAVSYGGSSYLALAGSVGIVPGTDASKWVVIALAGSSLSVSVLTQAVFPGYAGAGDTVTTTFNADGSITITYATSGLSETVTFNADGSITESYSGALSHVKTTTFPGGQIVESVA